MHDCNATATKKKIKKRKQTIGKFLFEVLWNFSGYLMRQPLKPSLLFHINGEANQKEEMQSDYWQRRMYVASIELHNSISIIIFRHLFSVFCYNETDSIVQQRKYEGKTAFERIKMMDMNDCGKSQNEYSNKYNYIIRMNRRLDENFVGNWFLYGSWAERRTDAKIIVSLYSSFFFFIQSLFRQNMIIFINRFRFMNNNRLKSSFSFLLHSKSVYLNYMKTKQMIYDAAFLHVGFSYLSFACFWRIDRYRRHCIICIAWYYMEKQQSGRNSQDALTKLERRCKQNFFVFFQRI